MVFIVHLGEKRVAESEQDKLIRYLSIDLLSNPLEDSGNIRPNNNWHSIIVTLDSVERPFKDVPK